MRIHTDVNLTSYTSTVCVTTSWVLIKHCGSITAMSYLSAVKEAERAVCINAWNLQTRKSLMVWVVRYWLKIGGRLVMKVLVRFTLRFLVDWFVQGLKLSMRYHGISIGIVYSSELYILYIIWSEKLSPNSAWSTWSGKFVFRHRFVVEITLFEKC